MQSEQKDAIEKMDFFKVPQDSKIQDSRFKIQISKIKHYI